MNENEFYDKVFQEMSKRTKLLNDLNDWNKYFAEKLREIQKILRGVNK